MQTIDGASSLLVFLRNRGPGDQLLRWDLRSLSLGRGRGRLRSSNGCAKVSPGKRTKVQSIATTDRTVAPFLFDVMGSLSFPAEPLQTFG